MEALDAYPVLAIGWGPRQVNFLTRAALPATSRLSGTALQQQSVPLPSPRPSRYPPWPP